MFSAALHLFRPILVLFALALSLAAVPAAGQTERDLPGEPVVLALDGEFGLTNSTSAESIQRGILTAIDDINRNGGVLGGRPLTLITREHRSISARGIKNIRELATIPGLVAVFGGRFSPVVIEELPVLEQTRTLFLAPWSSADDIVDNGMEPNYIFRLSLRDSLAMPFLLKRATDRGLTHVGLLLTNTAWGRSNLEAANSYLAGHKTPDLVGTAWYNWRDRSLIDKYQALADAGAQAILLVANDDEAAVLVREVAALPPQRRLPILSHWGVTGGDFVGQAGPALQEVDFSVIQTVSPFRIPKDRLAPVLETAGRLFGIHRPEDIVSPVGFLHAYDLTRILALAIDRAGTADRAAVRDALEQVGPYHGVTRDYDRPFAPGRHEALGPDDLLMARFRADGVLVPVD
ncbi:ABC transporter substrate-binding protein [Azospirillum sp. TSH7]|uniref:ABC transporter substrate-binding protein n=1 Tax=unclassified Azospirillum TaxID=2630922 RepID=UPI000D60D9A0|nr:MULTISPECIES: ABC transporter substrate-binding protein [unclassified Azospirillum]PWC57393.1 ABC transporter substrate-binding protein [Azospirillum sp. TSH7]PWC60923.1 ABC transporter substrate-binding protein [Azospirillum sp. TSH20]